MGASLLFAGWFKEFCSSGPCRKALVLLLKNALERVFVLGSKRKDIRHFLLGFFARVGAANSFSLIVDAIHLRNGFVVGHPKETFQHTNDEIHWSTVVIQQRYVAAREVRHLCDLSPLKFGYSTSRCGQRVLLAKQRSLRAFQARTRTTAIRTLKHTPVSVGLRPESGKNRGTRKAPNCVADHILLLN